jgi:hypothetical protein
LACSYGHVVGGHVGVHVDVHPHGLRVGLLGSVGRLLRRLHRLVEHLHVELEAERGDVPGLLVAEQVAGAAQLEVAHGDLEARAELGVVAQGAQALLGVLRQRGRRGVQQVGVGALARPADPPADLVELGQAEHVGALDDERVRLRDVDARLDDRRGHEDVGLAAQEAQHPLLELGLVELAVGHLERHVRGTGRAGARPSRRSSRRGCAGRTPARRGPSRGAGPA